ncbi:hypothetical protein EIQ19_12025 [Xanthomonas campestris pv. campestris]
MRGGSLRSGVGNRESGIGNREWGMGSRESQERLAGARWRVLAMAVDAGYPRRALAGVRWPAVVGARLRAMGFTGTPFVLLTHAAPLSERLARAAVSAAGP